MLQVQVILGFFESVIWLVPGVEVIVWLLEYRRGLG
jgi:hypothetical protein